MHRDFNSNYWRHHRYVDRYKRRQPWSHREFAHRRINNLPYVKEYFRDYYNPYNYSSFESSKRPIINIFNNKMEPGPVKPNMDGNSDPTNNKQINNNTNNTDSNSQDSSTDYTNIWLFLFVILLVVILVVIIGIPLIMFYKK